MAYFLVGHNIQAKLSKLGYADMIYFHQVFLLLCVENELTIFFVLILARHSIVQQVAAS
jgi:hypothetical protein